ncbi:unnamed protein product [Meganyctiphanes norvegica]|uniref:Uncharacterized protein n=1 Tax=Meganyctiphanes norvegica TaxID=48144 RepID=A0AAV2QRM4_MEGNR
MASSEANLGRGNDVTGGGGPRHLQGFNSFQFVSQLVSATPPYLFNMSAPFPGNFFSDLLRRMAPRAGKGLPLDQTLQQHIRAALLAKSAPPPPPTLPPTAMPPPLSLGEAHRPSVPQMGQPDKGVKRSLFSDVTALSSSCEDEGLSKRQRLDDPVEHHPSEAVPAPPFPLMHAPFMHGAVAPHHDVLSPWSARANLLRPQVPLAAHGPPAPPLDPYRLLLDLRLAGQLRTMAANQALSYAKDLPPPPKDLPHLLHKPHSPPPPSTGNPGSEITSRHSRDDPPPPPLMQVPPTSTTSPNQESKTSSNNNNAASITSLQGGNDDRVSAFHPPSRNAAEGSADTSDDDNGGRSSRGSSSGASTTGVQREGMGPQYIFRHLTHIYRAIEGNKEDLHDPRDPRNDTREASLHEPVIHDPRDTNNEAREAITVSREVNDIREAREKSRENCVSPSEARASPDSTRPITKPEDTEEHRVESNQED